MKSYIIVILDIQSNTKFFLYLLTPLMPIRLFLLACCIWIGGRLRVTFLYFPILRDWSESKSCFNCCKSSFFLFCFYLPYSCFNLAFLVMISYHGSTYLHSGCFNSKSLHFLFWAVLSTFPVESSALKYSLSSSSEYCPSDHSAETPR